MCAPWARRERAVNSLQQLLARCENVMDAIKTLWERRLVWQGLSIGVALVKMCLFPPYFEGVCCWFVGFRSLSPLIRSNYITTVNPRNQHQLVHQYYTPPFAKHVTCLSCELQLSGLALCLVSIITEKKCRFMWNSISVMLHIDGSILKCQVFKKAIFREIEK